MRGPWMVMIVLVAAAVVATIAIINASREEVERDPPIPERAVRDTVGVWYAETDDYELLLRPYYADGARQAFNDAQWNRHLGVERPRTYCRLWVVRAAKDEVAAPWAAEDAVLAFGKDGRAEDVGTLLEAGGDGVPRWFATIARHKSARGRDRLAGGELHEAVYALPAHLGIDRLDGLRLTGETEIVFRFARMGVEELWRYEKRPDGALAPLLLEDADDGKQEDQQASQGR